MIPRFLLHPPFASVLEDTTIGIVETSFIISTSTDETIKNDETAPSQQQQQQQKQHQRMETTSFHNEGGERHDRK